MDVATRRVPGTVPVQDRELEEAQELQVQIKTIITLGDIPAQVIVRVAISSPAPTTNHPEVKKHAHDA